MSIRGAAFVGQPVPAAAGLQPRFDIATNIGPAGRPAAGPKARPTRLMYLGSVLLVALPLAAQKLESCRDLNHHGRPEEASACYRALLSSEDPYLRAEAAWALRRFEDANDDFRKAVALQPKNAEYRVRWGRLFLDREQNQDAVDLFREALEINSSSAGALLGLALVASEGFQSGAVEIAHKALEADPKLTAARVLLASMALEDNNARKAIEEADKALAVDPDCLEALSLKATIDWLDDKPASPYLPRILKINPAYGEVYATAGRFFVLNRRYEEAIGLYRKALELNPNLYKARAELGLNLMRLARDAEARQNLEACYRAGETYPAVGNPLRLLDSYKNFKFFKSGNTVLKLHEKEAELLQPYFEAELKRDIATYEQKYKMHLDRPVQVEVYPDHEDFAVRILGMPGMGALGVTFVNVIAMDSPSSRKPGEYHWASTMRHELSHVYTLAATHQRMPRWFTEGLAVYEETAASPEWGDRLSPPVILAIREKKLLPVAELDRGFVHPAFPEQVVVSYFQAGRICNFIAQKWGFQKLLDMTRAFAAVKTTPDVIREQLGIAPEEFDSQFQSWLWAQTKKTVEGFDDWKKGMQRISELLKAGNNDDVIREAPAVRDLYPEFVEGGNLYEVLADAYLVKGDKASAAAELQRYQSAGGKNPATLKQLATLLEGMGRRKEAIETLNRINYIYPLDEELHRRLGDLYLADAKARDAIREYRVLVAMKPLDLAASRYLLARAYRLANQTEEAKEQVLLSLEAAPGYRPAQKLLLELSQ